MYRAYRVFLFGLFLSLFLSSWGTTAEDYDSHQRRLNEEAYQHRFDRDDHPDELTGIRVSGDEERPDGIVPLPQPLGPNWKLVLLTGDDSISAFDNARKKLFEIFSGHGVRTAIQLSRASKQQVGGVRPTSIANLEQAMTDLQVREEDGCVVHLTSHGSPQGFYLRGQSNLTPDKLDSILDKACGTRPTVLLVSACYSGIFAEPKMEAPNRIILTAARKDRTSFGCSAEATYTYWDGCLVDHLPKAKTWLELADDMEKCIEAKESGGGFARSYPQARFGAEVKDLEIQSTGF
jgi:hypothetical protein